MDIEKQEIALRNILNKHFSDLHIHCYYERGMPHIIDGWHELVSHFCIDLIHEGVSFGLVKKRIISMLKDELKLVQEKLRQVEEKVEGEESKGD